MAIALDEVNEFLHSGIRFNVEGRSHTLDIPDIAAITLIIQSLDPKRIITNDMWNQGAKSVAHGAAMAIAVSGVTLAKIWQCDTTHYRCHIRIYVPNEIEPLFYAL